MVAFFPAQPTYSFGDSSQMFAFATSQAGAAQNYILELGLLSASLTPPTIHPVFPSGFIPPAISLPAAPATQPIIWVAPGVPSAFTGALANIDQYFPPPSSAHSRP